jgi:hypothetical protein
MMRAALRSRALLRQVYELRTIERVGLAIGTWPYRSLSWETPPVKDTQKKARGIALEAPVWCQ